MPSLFDSESLPGSREPLQEAAVWRFDLLASRTRLTQHIVLKGECRCIRVAGPRGICVEPRGQYEWSFRQ